MSAPFSFPVDRNIVDSWDIPADATESYVTYNGNREYHPELRQSKFVRSGERVPVDKYPAAITEVFGKPYQGCIIDYGTMHIYEVDCFMKPHTDRYRGRLNDLHHTHTLVIFSNTGYTGGELMVHPDGPVASRTRSQSDSAPLIISEPGECTAVVFPIKTKHEITPVLSGTRVSYSFPMYTKFPKPEAPTDDSDSDSDSDSDITNTCCERKPVLED